MRVHVQCDVCPAHCALCTVREVETNTTTGRVDISIVNLHGSTSTTLKDTKTNNEYYYAQTLEEIQFVV